MAKLQKIHFRVKTSKLILNDSTLMKLSEENEGDSSHSVIEKALKNGPIYVPAHYAAIVRNARKKGSRFQVHELCHKDFKDLKVLNENVANSPFNTNTNGVKFNFNDICIIQVNRSDLNHFFYKVSYKDNNFSSVQIDNMFPPIYNIST